MTDFDHEVLTLEDDRTVRDIGVVDAFEQGAIQNWLPLEIVQLSPGSYQGRVRIIDQQDVSVVFEAQNCAIHKRGVMADGVCTVSFVRESSERHRFSDYNTGENSLFFLPGGTEFDVHMIQNSSTVYFRFDQVSLLHKLRAMNPEKWEEQPEDLIVLDTINKGRLDRFADFLCQTDQAGHRNTELGTIITDQIVMALSTAISPGERDQSTTMSLGRARRIVDQFIEYVSGEFHQQRCPSMVDVCLALGFSQRTLQYSFQKILGVTPIAYLRYLRLNHVRHELLNPHRENETVTSIAMQWHFVHLGKFSADYYQMFGELPSKTLKQAREKFRSVAT